MTFSYNADTATPGYGGLAEFPGLRINVGTFKPLTVPPLVQSPPLRVSSAPVPRGGGTVSAPLLDTWQFDVSGFFDVGSPDDIQGAIDYLRAHVNAALGWLTLTLDAPGWADPRTMTVQVVGQVVVDEPEIARKKVPRRTFTVPLIASDPRMYGPETTTTVTTGTTLTNAGTAPAPFTVRFNGPRTSPPSLNGPGAGNIIALTSNIAGGDWVEVTTVDPATGTMTAVDQDGNDAFGLIATDSADYIYPGLSSWDATGTGSGDVDVTVRSAWA